MWWHDAGSNWRSPRIRMRRIRCSAPARQGRAGVRADQFRAATFQIALPKLDFLQDFDRAYVSGVMGVIKPDPRDLCDGRTGLRHCRPKACCSPMTAPTTSPPPRARGWRTHQFESWQGWAGTAGGRRAFDASRRQGYEHGNHRTRGRGASDLAGSVLTALRGRPPPAARRDQRPVPVSRRRYHAGPRRLDRRAGLAGQGGHHLSPAMPRAGLPSVNGAVNAV